MKSVSAKISFIILITFLVACNSLKRVDKDEQLLVKNRIHQNGDRIHTKGVFDQLEQTPNQKLPLIGYPLKLQIYNQADLEADSTFYDWLDKKPNRKEGLINLMSRKQLERLGNGYVGIHEFLANSGEKPVVLDSVKSVQSAKQLEAWYWNHGWFNAETDFEIHRQDNRRAKVDYYVDTKEPYILDSLDRKIASKVVDSLYRRFKGQSFLKEGEQFNVENFEKERERLKDNFRNNGVYHFEKQFITFEADTVNTDHKANVDVVIPDREGETDSTYVPFKIHHISDVNIFTNFSSDNKDQVVSDSASYENYSLYSFGELKYNPEALADAIFIKPGAVYSDRARTLTYRRFTDIDIFEYPNIQYMEDPRDSTEQSLIANVFLSPKPKFGVDFNTSVSRSNIQDFGIGFSTSLLVRNIFGGAETLEISGRGSIGSSNDAAIDESRFFNISEVGANVNIDFPKIAFPFNTDKIIPKSMSPFTTLGVGWSSQRNIGLDKQNVTGKFEYRWYPSQELTHRFQLLDLQYVRNLNSGNYFNVYRNSFGRLNKIAQNNRNQVNSGYFENPDEVNSDSRLQIPEGTKGFINSIQNDQVELDSKERDQARNIIERRDRLTQDNLILASSYNYTRNTRENIYDNQFTQFRFKIEAAGNILSTVAPWINLDKNKRGNRDLFGVQFSQYVKGEVDLIKHWDLGNQNIVAVRGLLGLAAPYGNSNSIPFARSFFAGGANDNRGWQPYDLGPGSSGSLNEFNEANMKITFNAEYRFNLFGSLNSAFFVDVGNIWNALDNVKNERSQFTGFSDLGELAVSSGFGLRYDLDFFVIRFDLGFKTFDPAYNKQKWFKDYNFSNSVINVGINYPF